MTRLCIAISAALMVTSTIAADLSVDQVRAALKSASPTAAADFAGKDLSDLDLSGLDFRKAAHEAGFRIAVLFVIDAGEDSLKTAAAVEDILLPDIFVPVANRFVGSALPDGVPGPVLTMEKLDPDLHAITSNRRFSFRTFLMGEESGVPLRLRSNLKNVLQGLMAGMREFEPALSLQTLREQDLSQP